MSLPVKHRRAAAVTQRFEVEVEGAQGAEHAGTRVALEETGRVLLQSAVAVGNQGAVLADSLLACRIRSWHSAAVVMCARLAARPDHAIEIAVRSGMPLKIAAKVDRVDRVYWESEIRPMIEAHPNVEFIGEIGEDDKADFLAGAEALLFPVDWPEPFGLVMIEAMACGTPVIAFRRGSVPEVLEDGTSGFIVDTLEQAVAAVPRITHLDRAKVRASFERRFTAERMAGDYLKI